MEYHRLEPAHRSIGDINQVARPKTRLDGDDIDGFTGPAPQFCDNRVAYHRRAFAKADYIDHLRRIPNGPVAGGWIEAASTQASAISASNSFSCDSRRFISSDRVLSSSRRA